MKKLCIFIFLLFSFLTNTSEAFDKVVIWGHKLHSNTFSYIFDAFDRAFKHLGYETYWFDNSENVSGFDFSNCLFITEGQVEDKIPLRSDCIYYLHNTNHTKYKALNLRTITFQVYTDDVLKRPCTKIDTGIYYDIPGRCLYMPWATDLLPNEIDEIKRNLPFVQKTKTVYWIGTMSGNGVFGNLSEIEPFMKGCKENGISFVARNPSATGIGREEHIDLISRAYMAPTIVGEWQKQVGYIPCRIFKNVSYGQMGITNSKRVYEIFKGKIVYNPDTYQLFYDAKKRLKTTTVKEIYELMDFVKTKHTYINRIQTMLDFFNVLENE